jgi:hypothetical protein
MKRTDMNVVSVTLQVDCESEVRDHQMGKLFCSPHFIFPKPLNRHFEADLGFG